MKNNHQKLDELFADIDGAFVEQASTPPKRAGKPFYIGLIAALIALATLTVSILPALFQEQEPPALPSEPSAVIGSGTVSNGSPLPSTPTPVISDDSEASLSVEPSVQPSDPFDSFSEPSDEPVDPPVSNVPAWYTPGSLTVVSLTRRAAQTVPAATASVPAAVNQTLTLVESSASLNPVNGRYVNLTALSADSEHNEHGCLLYDVQSDEMLCYGCMAKDLIAESLKEGERIVIDASTTPDLLSFAIYREQENKITARYIYEPQKELLRQVPLLSEQDSGLYTVSPDGRYLLTASERQDGSGCFDYFLIDVETLTPKVVSDGYPAFHEASFSPDGKNLLIVLVDEDGSTHIDTDKVRYLMVNADTGASTLCEGKILSYANGLLVTRYRTDYHVYDRQEAREIEIPENTYAFEIRQSKVIRINVQSGTEEQLTALPDAWKLSNDGLYAYAYTTGNSYLTVYSLESGETFKVDVSSDFSASVKELQKTKDLRYYISLNEEGNELLICYSVSAKTAKPKDNTLQATKDAFAESSSIEEFLLRFEELCTVTHTYKIYKGEGYTQLLIKYCVVVEDYRAGTFTIYLDSDYEHTGISDSTDLLGEERIVSLSSSKDDTDRFLENRGLTAREATVDYADFYENGKFSKFKARNYIITPVYLDQVDGFYPMFNRNLAGMAQDMTYLRLFMAELNDCQKTFTASAPFKESDAVDLARLSYEPTLIQFWGTLCTKGVYRIKAWNNEYFVPEYVFADFVSLTAFSEFNSAYTLTEGENMTVADLRAIVQSGLSTDAFSGYAYRKLAWDGINGQRRLFPVFEGEEQIGYAYIKITEEGNVKYLTLFDTDYRYIAFPEIDGIPQGEWIYKGHIDFKADQ